MLGGVTIWNDFDHCDSKTLTLMIKSFIDQVRIKNVGNFLKFAKAISVTKSLKI